MMLMRMMMQEQRRKQSNERRRKRIRERKQTKRIQKMHLFLEKIIGNSNNNKVIKQRTQRTHLSTFARATTWRQTGKNAERERETEKKKEIETATPMSSYGLGGFHTEREGPVYVGKGAEPTALMDTKELFNRFQVLSKIDREGICVARKLVKIYIPNIQELNQLPQNR